METEAPALVARAYLDRVIDGADEEALQTLVDPSFVNADPPAGFAPDRDGLRAIVAYLHAVLEGFRAVVGAVEDDGDGWVTTRVTLTGRLKKDAFGRVEGEDVAIPVADRLRIADGRVAERRAGAPDGAA